MLSTNNAWAVGSKGNGASGVIIHWNGSEWTLFQEVDQPLRGLKMLSANDGWAVGYGGLIYHYDGVTWSNVPSPTSEVLMDVDFAPDGEGWAAGHNGALLRYADCGGGLRCWRALPTEEVLTDAFDFRAIDFTSGHGWVVGAHYNKGIGGQILEYDDGLWQAVTPPTDNRLNAVANVSDNDAWAVGAADSAGGTIIHWDGKHWQRWYQHDLPIPAADLYTIDMVSATDGWAAGDPLTSGTSAVFLHWDGHRWAEPRYDAPVNVRVNSLNMFGPDFGWAVADNGDAVAKYDGVYGYWNANHTCQGIYYQCGVPAWCRTQSLHPPSHLAGMPGQLAPGKTAQSRMNISCVINRVARVVMPGIRIPTRLPWR